MISTRATLLLFCALAPPTALAQTDADNWPAYNRTYDSERYSPLAEITPRNVAGLHPLCSYDTGETTSFQTGPLVLDGAIYFTTDLNTYAIDAATCALRWKNEHNGPPSAFRVHRGTAYLDGKLFRDAGDGEFVAIDARTGRMLWETPIADPKLGESIPAAPIAWNGMVFVGNAAGDYFGVTGRIYALNAQTGRPIWRFDMVPPTMPESMALSGSTGALTAAGGNAEAERRAAETWPPPRFPGAPSMRLA